MNTFFKKLYAIALLFIIVGEASADRGVGRKNKNKATLNISVPSTIRNSISFNLKSGLSYKGSLLNNRSSFVSGGMINTSVVTYKKGNITYIVPYKNKITLAEIKPGYTGMKIIIRKK